MAITCDVCGSAVQLTRSHQKFHVEGDTGPELWTYRAIFVEEKGLAIRIIHGALEDLLWKSCAKKMNRLDQRSQNIDDHRANRALFRGEASSYQAERSLKFLRHVLQGGNSPSSKQ